MYTFITLIRSDRIGFTTKNSIKSSKMSPGLKTDQAIKFSCLLTCFSLMFAHQGFKTSRGKGIHVIARFIGLDQTLMRCQKRKVTDSLQLTVHNFNGHFVFSKFVNHIYESRCLR